VPEIARLTGVRGWIDLEFVERQRTPESAMAVGIQSHISGLSLSNSVALLEAWVSNAVKKHPTIGCRKEIYSPTRVRV
jgi:hypothetical protein